jgi:hypothetical protein
MAAPPPLQRRRCTEVRLIAIGRRQRSDHRGDSDHDLVAIVPDDADPDRLGSRRFYGNCRDLPGPAGQRRRPDLAPVPIRRPAERVAASLPATVVRDGRLVHAA